MYTYLIHEAVAKSVKMIGVGEDEQDNRGNGGSGERAMKGNLQRQCDLWLVTGELI